MEEITSRWVRDELASAEVETAKRLGIDAYDVLTKIATRVSPGADGLLFHPYFCQGREHRFGMPMREAHSLDSDFIIKKSI